MSMRVGEQATSLLRLVLMLTERATHYRRVERLIKRMSRSPFALIGCNNRTAVQQKLHASRDSLALIILDSSFSGCDALGVLTWLIEREPEIPVLIVCPIADEATALRGLELGAEDYLIESEVTFSVLNRMMQSILARAVVRRGILNQQTQARITLASIGDGVIVTDATDRITFANAAAMKLCRAGSDKDLVGTRFKDSVKVIVPDALAPLDPPARAIAEARVVRLPNGSKVQCLDGALIDIDDSAAPIHDTAGRITGAVMVFRDVTANRELTRQLQHLAHHDALTGLPNRLLFEERLAQAFDEAARCSRHLAVLYIDIDRFKAINGTLGHSAGDSALKIVAQRLSTLIRATDTVCRQGGDEFVVLLTSITKAEDVIPIASKLLAGVAKPIISNSQNIRLSASMGIAIYPDDGGDTATVLRRADVALSSAKQGGRRNYQFFRTEINSHAPDDRAIEGSLSEAIKARQFELYYQPIYDLQHSRIVRAEALLRWRHPSLGDISPGRFIPIAEQSGHIVAIGQWVFKEALRQLDHWQHAGKALVPIAVNVSPVELQSEQFVGHIESALEKAKVPGHLLEMEITETALVSDERKTSLRLSALRSLGIQCALDDFGLGFSSLSYLKHFPIDSLKIDKSFVAGLTSSDADSHIVQAIISLGTSFNLRVVAEGIETHEQLDALGALKCGEGQGYLLCPPIQATEFSERLSLASLHH